LAMGRRWSRNGRLWRRDQGLLTIFQCASPSLRKLNIICESRRKHLLRGAVVKEALNSSPGPRSKNTSSKVLSYLLDERLAGKTPEEVICTQFGVALTRRHFSCFLPNKWFTDEVVNCYLRLVQERHAGCWCPNSFFWPTLENHGPNAVLRWARRAAVDWTSLKAVLVPLHLFQNHWALCVVDLRAHALYYYDSLSYKPVSSLVPSIQEFLCASGLPGDWPLLKQSVPQQRNNSDCGVFTCAFASRFASEVPIDFETSQSAVNKLREEQASALYHGRI